jgi:choline-sulfatase
MKLPRFSHGRTVLIFCSCVAALTSLASCRSPVKPAQTQQEVATPPRATNIVLVTIDTLRADRLGSYGYSKGQTPNLDHFARNGVLFENAVTPTPLTAPSHASIFTGLYPTAHKVRDTGGFILQPSLDTLARILQREGWDTAAFVGSSVLKKHFGFSQGFAVYDDEMPKPDARKIATDFAERRAGDVVNRAIAWLGRESGKQFFLWVHVFDPHFPYEPPAPYREKFRGSPYDGEVAYTDQELGRLFASVSKKSAPENTLIAVLADHGESLGDHGEYSHGVFLYDSTLRIPFLLAGAGVPAGVRVKQQARTIDLLPTLLELAGQKPPLGVQGASLTPSFTGKQDLASWSYLESFYPKLNLGWAELRGIRTNKWKYVRAPKPELYDLTQDPTETTNVIESHPKQVQQLEARLKSVAGIDGQSGEKVETTMLDQRTLQQLKSLGYLGGSSAREYALTGQGIDPKDGVDVLKWLNLALTADSLSSSSRRAGVLEKALAADPSNPTVIYYLGEQYGKTGRQSQAVKLYQDAIRNGLQNAWLFSRLGYLYLQQGDKPNAIAAYEKAAQLNPSDVESVNDLGMAYLELGKLDDAERAFKWSLATDAKYALAYNGLGLVAIQKQDLATARKYFESAGQLDPDLLEAQLNLGRIYKIKGDNARARACFEVFLAKASPAEYGPVIKKLKEELATMQ